MVYSQKAHFLLSTYISSLLTLVPTYSNDIATMITWNVYIFFYSDNGLSGGATNISWADFYIEFGHEILKIWKYVYRNQETYCTTLKEIKEMGKNLL